jgi:hypothetical protein
MSFLQSNRRLKQRAALLESGERNLPARARARERSSDANFKGPRRGRERSVADWGSLTARRSRSSRTVSGAFGIAELSVRDFFAGTTRNIATPAWACSPRRWCTMAKRKTFCGNARKCSMLPPASSGALRTKRYRSFPAKFGLTSRLLLRNRCLCSRNLVSFSSVRFSAKEFRARIA